MDIKKAKELIKELIAGVEKYGYDFTVEESVVINKKEYKAIEVLLNELDKKEKITNAMKWKPISKYSRKKYDWVLVKYFDGDYECVPEVAEKRSDGKWYTSERQIPFEVKYFFDMQEILEEE